MDKKNVEVSNAQVPKTETTKSEVPKTEVPKSEVPKSDVPKSEVPKSDVPKSEVPKTETPKSEAAKATQDVKEAPKPEISNVQPKNESPITETTNLKYPDDKNADLNVPNVNDPNYVSPPNYGSTEYNQNISNPQLNENSEKKPYTKRHKVIGVIFAILLPPVAVGLKNGIDNTFWINLLLLLLFHLFATVHALYVIFSKD